RSRNALGDQLRDRPRPTRPIRLPRRWRTDPPPLPLLRTAKNLLTRRPRPAYAPLKTYVDAAADLLAQYPTNLFDLSKTEEILTRKGYAKDGDGFWAKDGQKLSLVLTTFSVFADLAPFVTQQLQNAGID